MRQIRKNPEPDHFFYWKMDYKSRNGREAVYDDLKGAQEYFLLKKNLLEEQGYICCYCEKRIGQEGNLSDCDIEHFMPRHPDSKLYLCRNVRSVKMLSWRIPICLLHARGKVLTGRIIVTIKRIIGLVLKIVFRRQIRKLLGYLVLSSPARSLF